MFKDCRRNILSILLVALSLSAGIAPLYAAYTDQADYIQDLRKAKTDLPKRLDIHLLYIKDTMAKVLKDKDDQRARGLRYRWTEAAKDYKKLEAERSATDPEVVKYKAALNELGTDITNAEKKIKSAILNQPAPKDVYAGKDKDAIRAKIKTAWKERYPEDQIVAIRFDKSTWDLNKKREWVDSGGYWRDINVSVLTVRVIIKKDPETATIHGIFVQRDNDNPDSGVEIGRKGVFAPTDILLANVK